MIIEKLSDRAQASCIEASGMETTGMSSSDRISGKKGSLKLPRMMASKPSRSALSAWPIASSPSTCLA